MAVRLGSTGREAIQVDGCWRLPRHGNRWPWRSHGFTLIELVIVIAVIGILTAVVLPVVNRTIEESRKTRFADEFRRIRHGMTKYFSDVGSFMAESDPWGSEMGLVYPQNVFYRHRSGYKGPYLDYWPSETPWGFKAKGCGAVGAFTLDMWSEVLPDFDGVPGNERSIKINADCVPYPVPYGAQGVDDILDDGNLATGRFQDGGTGGKMGFFLAGEGPAE